MIAVIGEIMSSTSVSGISSPGIGSGLDVAGLVSSLMAVEKQPLTQLTSKQTSYQTQVSAIGQVTSALSTLRDAARAMSTATSTTVLKGTVADTAIASVGVTNAAAPGNYNLEVTSLATQQKLATTPFGSSSTSLGTGTGSVTIEFGTTNGTGFSLNANQAAFTVNLATSDLTPAGVRDAINAANKGVTATLVNDANGSRMVLTNNNTGANQSMRVSVSDPDGNSTDGTGLSALAYNPAGTTNNGKNMSQLAAAGDAQFKLDSIPLTSSSNTVSGVVDGLTLTLTGTNSGAPTILNVSSDDAAMTKKVETFISAYNSVNNLISTLTGYNAATKKGGTLQADSSVRNVRDKLRNVLISQFGTGSSNLLSSIGITIQKDGTLAKDATKFSNAFATDRNSVVSLFTQSTTGTQSQGLAGTMNTLIGQMIDTGGTLESHTKSVNQSITDIGKRISSMQDRLSLIEARYNRQFNSLDTSLSQMQGVSSYLTQQLAALAANTGK
jgi:flagellar hook-associated protein 2